MGVPAEVASARESDRFGKFVRVMQIGSGGMGEVWKAWDVELGRWVALKFLHPGQGDEIARFKREAQTAAKLTHPNIAAVYEVAEDRGRHFIAMQFIDGVTLKKVPRSDRRALAAYVRDAARAVGYGHAQGIIHRDLKPENVMVAGGHVFVTDFGLARPTHGATQLTRTGDVIGTPAYMSPEQAVGDPLDAGTDVWSLGATLYELLADGPPFQAANSLETMLKVREEEPRPLRRIDPTIEPDLETIVLKCLEKPRDRRYVTAMALAADLDRWIRGEPILASRAGAMTTLGRKLARRKAVVALAGVAVLSLAAGATALALLRAKDRRLTEQRDALHRREEELLTSLRRTADTSLDAVLALRRAGDLDGMRRLADRLREDCERVRSELPRAAEPDFLLGRLHRALMLDDDALAYQEQSLGKDSSFAPARYERAVLLARRYSRLFARASDATRAMDGAVTAERARALDRPSREDIERFDPRLAEIRRAVGTDLVRLAGEGRADGTEARTVRGLLALHEQRFEAAADELRAALQTDPHREEAWEALAESLAARLVTAPTETRDELLDELVKAQDEAARRDRGYLPIVRGLGEALAARAQWRGQTGRDPTADWDAAEKALADALALSPRDADTLLERAALRVTRGWWLVRRGRRPDATWTGAQEDFGAIVATDPSDLRGRRGLATVHVSRAAFLMATRGDPVPEWSAAETHLASILDSALEDAGARIVRAELRYSRGLHQMNRGGDPCPDWAAGEDDLTQSLQRDRTHARAWQVRADLRAARAGWLGLLGRDATEDMRAAEADAGEAIRLRPGATAAWKARGRVRGNRGLHAVNARGDPLPDWDAAERDFNEVLRLDPADAEAWSARADIRYNRAQHLSDGQPEAARREFGRAAADYEEALRQNPALQPTLGRWLDECRQKSR